MSNFEYKREGKEVSIIATGTMQDIVIEIGHMVQGIHDGIKSQSDTAAKVFQMAIQGMFTDDSPVWSEPKRPEGGVMIAMVTPNEE